MSVVEVQRVGQLFFRERINTLSYPVAWPNAAFKPPRDTWLRVSFLYPPPQTIETFDSGRRRALATTRIGVFTVIGTGDADAFTAAGQVLGLFPIPSFVSRSGLHFTIENAGMRPGPKEDAYHHQIVDIDWYVDT